ncbi:hypothetical protein PR202_gb00037 [Eleusine coracana subsp. coracana]|uniref:Uncharacterized protein n=1 Tax=Eleusine coracana subsp. coracana TaxID=191504 RepID=A0AAV5DRN3_ELECO|nr:hypothetical protein PR202_gb00037 [Eleusine coracana subsp. coracana]
MFSLLSMLLNGSSAQLISCVRHSHGKDAKRSTGDHVQWHGIKCSGLWTWEGLAFSTSRS